MGVVYIHTNLTNRKVYVGQTWFPHQRKLDHCNPSNKSRFAKAIQKYGWDGFDHYYSDEISSQDELDNLERLWIIVLQATDKSFGYNCRYGGSRGLHTEETKAILRAKRAKQGPPSEEGRRRISERHRGQKYNLGKKASKEARRKMSGAHRGIKQSVEWVAKRVVAANKTKALNPRVFSLEQRQKISDSLRGNTRTLGYKHTEESRKKMSLSRQGKKQNPIHVQKRIESRLRTLAARKVCV